MKLFAVLLLASVVAGLDEDGTKEIRCVPKADPSTVGLDKDWFAAIKQMYVPLWSQLHATRTAVDVFYRDAKDIAFHEVQPASCLVWRDQDVSAFGRDAKFNITVETDTINFRGPWPASTLGKFNFHKTDNKNYILGVACWGDDEASWAVVSKKPFLDQNAQSEILNYVKSLGFDTSKAVAEDYTYCRQQFQYRHLQPVVTYQQQYLGW